MNAAGFGFRKSATLASLQDALSQAAGSQSVSLIATASDKSVSICFQQLADLLSVPTLAIPQADLDQISTLTNSPTVKHLRGSGSIAEAAALVAAGPGASLLGRRAISADRMATCAIAIRTST